MRTAANHVIVRLVDNRRLRLVVEIEPGEPVCGSAGIEGERQIPFEGLLGFLSLFDRLRGERQAEPDTAGGPESR
jgi:hypothetical protein